MLPPVKQRPTQRLVPALKVQPSEPSCTRTQLTAPASCVTANLACAFPWSTIFPATFPAAKSPCALLAPPSVADEFPVMAQRRPRSGSARALGRSQASPITVPEPEAAGGAGPGAGAGGGAGEVIAVPGSGDHESDTAGSRKGGGPAGGDKPRCVGKHGRRRRGSQHRRSNSDGGAPRANEAWRRHLYGDGATYEGEMKRVPVASPPSGGGRGTSATGGGNLASAPGGQGRRKGRGKRRQRSAAAGLAKWVRHGKGSYVDVNGNVFRGTWVEDEATGSGSKAFACGDHHEGMYERDTVSHGGT